MTMRYCIEDGSQSCHCCFEYTVVDLTRPVMIYGSHYKGKHEPVCECFTREDAELICDALNNMVQ